MMGINPYTGMKGCQGVAGGKTRETGENQLVETLWCQAKGLNSS